MYICMYMLTFVVLYIISGSHYIQLSAVQLQYAQSECYLDMYVCTVHVEILVQIYSDKN